MRADDCVWELPKNEVLTKCCHLTVLSDIYASFGDVQMKRYFERRGVPGQPHTAECYLRMRSNLMNAAEEFGKAWRRAEGNPEMAMVPLPSMAQPGGKISATDFLDQIWDALIFIYKGMSTLEGQERQALRPFSPVEAILVPLPGAGSMLEVARFHDGREGSWSGPLGLKLETNLADVLKAPHLEHLSFFVLDETSVRQGEAVLEFRRAFSPRADCRVSFKVPVTYTCTDSASDWGEPMGAVGELEGCILYRNLPARFGAVRVALQDFR
ncbi:unnamed protein product [Effrenium voratum]|nr:unnamed protein product [Effrenium voratum]